MAKVGSLFAVTNSRSYATIALAHARVIYNHEEKVRFILNVAILLA